MRVLGGTSIGGTTAFTGSGTILVDPTTATVGSIAASITVIRRPQARVTAAGGALGTLATATLAGAPGYLGVLFVGELGPRLAIPGVQFDGWLRPGTVLPAAAGVLGPPLAASLAVPANPLLLGSAFCWQGATFDPAVGVELTNPAPLLP